MDKDQKYLVRKILHDRIDKNILGIRDIEKGLQKNKYENVTNAVMFAQDLRAENRELENIIELLTK